ncbi:MAG: GNAT family N-acetyltransferase [Acidothermus sp.]|nr:GNAT family N-acetyltransferase [Acidothermus sp.]MCL6537554.1 GNAT family N-acetyltransferase [Acidothermus sp.]
MTAADDVSFRFATASDVATVVELVESAYRGESSRKGWTTEADLLDGQRTDAESVADLLRDPRSRILLGSDRSGVVACAHLRDLGDGRVYFGMFAVSPTAQAKGIGSRVLSEAEQVAAGLWGARELEMTVIMQRTELIEWYERRGYRRTGETRPFPYGDRRFGIPRRPDLAFAVLRKELR